MSNELIGAELDAAVARACNEPIAKIDDRGVWVRRPNHIDAFNIDIYSPSTDWSQGGPLVEKYKIPLDHGAKDGCLVDAMRTLVRLSK